MSKPAPELLDPNDLERRLICETCWNRCGVYTIPWTHGTCVVCGRNYKSDKLIDATREQYERIARTIGIRMSKSEKHRVVLRVELDYEVERGVSTGSLGTMAALDARHVLRKGLVGEKVYPHGTYRVDRITAVEVLDVHPASASTTDGEVSPDSKGET